MPSVRAPASTLERESTALDRLIAAAAAATPLPAVVGHLAVAGTGGRRRDVLLAGRGHVAGSLAVLDWRTAPLASVFFRHAAGDAYELTVADRELAGTVVARHLVEVRAGRVRAVRGDDLTATRNGDGWQLAATPPPPTPPPVAPAGPGALPELDPIQQRAVALPAGRALVVDGQAGVGKTLVGMYRVAHLMRTAAAAGRPTRALVLTPTEGLRRLCRILAERLGVAALDIATVDDWLVERARAAFPGLPVRTSTDAGAEVIRLKRHPAVRVAIDAVVARRHRRDVEDPLIRARADLLAMFGDRELLDRVAAASDGDLGRREVAAVAAHTRIQFTATSEDQHRHVDADRLLAVDDRRLDHGTPLGDADSFDVEDAPILFELARRRGHRPRGPRWDVILIDEAQLVAPLELAAIGDALAPRGTAIVAGDHRQATDDTAGFTGWDAAAAELGVTDFERVTLTVDYRSAPAITALARALAETPPAPVAAGQVALAASRFHGDLDQAAGLIAALDRATRAQPWLRVAVVTRTPEHARRVHRELGRGLDPTLVVDGDFDFGPGVVVTPAGQVQGLEFDAVVVPDLTPDFYPARPDVQRALYVALTRARDWLWLTTGAAWSPLVAVADPAPATPAVTRA